ncbi:hypothetical protein [Neorhodopirellula pilleata]|nr:hypothetical protein [Neorhodopirellula pilleata]
MFRKGQTPDSDFNRPSIPNPASDPSASLRREGQTSYRVRCSHGETPMAVHGRLTGAQAMHFMPWLRLVLAYLVGELAVAPRNRPAGMPSHFCSQAALDAHAGAPRPATATVSTKPRPPP